MKLALDRINVPQNVITNKNESYIPSIRGNYANNNAFYNIQHDHCGGV